MTEPFFGSVAAAWPTFPVSAYGYPHHQLATGNRGMTFGAPAALQAEAYGFNGGLIAGMPVPSPGTLPVLGSPEAIAGVMPSALLAAVAMRRGQPLGPGNDQEVEDFIYDALDLMPGGSEVEVRCESGRVTLTGTVQQKRVKRDAGEVAWAIPLVNDVQNNVTITARRRSRTPGREGESPSAVPGRKQA
jgi:hypothetical protein